MQAVERRGRYIPTAISMGEGEPIRIKKTASSIPARTKGHAISPPTMPRAMVDIKPAWGAGRVSLPMPILLWRSCREKVKVKAAATTPIMPPICIRQGVPPKMCPTFQSWIISPATPATQQTTAATPITAATPDSPVCPIKSIISAAMSKVVKVKPEMGLDEEPMIPTKYPATAANSRPIKTMTKADTRAEPMERVNTLYKITIGMIRARIAIVIEVKERSLSVRRVELSPSVRAFLTSLTERLIPVIRLFLILNNV